MENKKDYIKQISELLIDLINNSIQASKDAGLLDASIKHEYTIKNILNIVYDLNIINTNDIKSNYPGIDLVDEENNTVYQISSEKDKKGKIDETIKEIEKNDLIKKHSISHIVVIFLTKEKISFRNNSKETWEKWAKDHNVFLEYYNLDELKTKITNKLKKEHNDEKIYRFLQYLQINNKKALYTFEINKYYKKIYKNLQNFTTSNLIDLKKNVDNFMLSDTQILLIKAVQGHGKSHFINYLAENSNFNWHIPVLLTNTEYLENILQYFDNDLNWVIIIDDIDRYEKDFIQYLIDGILMYDNIKLIFTCRQSYNLQNEVNCFKVKYEYLDIKWEEKHIDELINKYKETHPKERLVYHEYDKIKYESNNNPYFILYFLDNDLINIEECKQKNFDDILSIILKRSGIENKQLIYDILMNICLNIPFNIDKIKINDNYKIILKLLVKHKFMHNNGHIYRFNYDIVGDLVLAFIIGEQIEKEHIFINILQHNSYNIMYNMSYALNYISKNDINELEEMFIDYIEEKNDISFLTTFIPIIYYLPNFAYRLFKKFNLENIDIDVIQHYIKALIHNLYINNTYKYSVNEISYIILDIYKYFKNKSLLSKYFTLKDDDITHSLFYSLFVEFFNIYEYDKPPFLFYKLYKNFIQKFIELSNDINDTNLLEKNLINTLSNQIKTFNPEKYNKYKISYLKFLITLNKNYINRNNNINGIVDYMQTIALQYNYLQNKKLLILLKNIIKQFSYSYKEQMIMEESIIKYMFHNDDIEKLDILIDILKIFQRPPLYIFYCYIKNFTAPYILETKLQHYNNFNTNEKILFQEKLLEYGLYYPREDIIPYKVSNLDDYFDYIKSQDNIIDFIINLDDGMYKNFDKFIEKYDDLVISLFFQYHKIKSCTVKKITYTQYFKIKNINISNKKILLCTDKNILFALIETINKDNINNINFKFLSYKIIELDKILVNNLLKKVSENFSYIQKNNINTITNMIIIFMGIPFSVYDLYCSHNISEIIKYLKEYKNNINKIKKHIINNIIGFITLASENANFIYYVLENLSFSIKLKRIIINNLLNSSQNRDVDYSIFKALRHFIENQDEFNSLINILINHFRKNINIKVHIHEIIDGIFQTNLLYFEDEEEGYKNCNNKLYEFFDCHLMLIEDGNIDILIDFLELFARYCTAKKVALILDKVYNQVNKEKIKDIIANTSNRYATINSDMYANMYLFKLEKHTNNTNIKSIIKQLIKDKIKYTEHLDKVSIDRYHQPRTPYGA